MAEEALPVEETTVVDPQEESAPAPLTLDVHMAPVLARMSGIGLVTEHQLLGFYNALRSALLAHLESPAYVEPVPAPPEPVVEEAAPEEAKLFS